MTTYQNTTQTSSNTPKKTGLQNMFIGNIIIMVNTIPHCSSQHRHDPRHTINIQKHTRQISVLKTEDYLQVQIA